jgi:hypothetical protein
MTLRIIKGKVGQGQFLPVAKTYKPAEGQRSLTVSPHNLKDILGHIPLLAPELCVASFQFHQLTSS